MRILANANFSQVPKVALGKNPLLYETLKDVIYSSKVLYWNLATSRKIRNYASLCFQHVTIRDLCLFSSCGIVIGILLPYAKFSKNLDHFCYCCKIHNAPQIHEIINGHIFTIGCPKIYIREVSNKKI